MDSDALDTLKKNSLRATGYAYMLGDAALFASGMLGGRKKEAMGALMWAGGGIICAQYGNPDADKQLKLLSRRLGDYLRRQNIEIPTNPTTEELARQGGLIDHIEAFLHAYPSQILNASYALGGVLLAKSGMQHANPWDTASGAVVTGGALAGLLVPEKKPDPKNPPRDALGKAWSWVQEKPLRIPAAAYLINDGTLTAAALKDHRQNPASKSYLFKLLTVASYIFGNAMLAASSKGHHGGGADNEAMNRLAESAAQVLAAQPAPLREAMTGQISGFLAAEPGIQMKAEEINALLQSKLAEAQSGIKAHPRIHMAEGAQPSL